MSIKKLSFVDNIRLVSDWYVKYSLKKNKKNIYKLTLDQIKFFENK